MNELPHFKTLGSHGEFRPVGMVTLDQGVKMVSAAIAEARKQGVARLLVVTTGLSGFESPSVGERYFMVREWAEVAGGLVRVAMVIPPEMIDPQKFGIMVAVNHGLTAEVFAVEEEALVWLMRGSAAL